MFTMELSNEKSDLFINVHKNDDNFSIKDIISILRYTADCLQNGDIIYDGQYIYTKPFKKTIINKC